MDGHLLSPRGRQTYKGLKIECACPGCGKTFSDPRVLPCKHVYCTDCISNMSRTYVDPTDIRKGTKSTCFICDTPFRLTAGNPTSMPKSEDVLDLIEFRESKQDASAFFSFNCDEHVDSEATKYCEDGCGHICQECASAHETAKVMKKHRLRDVVRSNLIAFETACSQHQSPFTEFCTLENMDNPFLCAACVGPHLREHKLHDHETYENGTEKICQHLEINRNKIEELGKSIENCKRNIEKKRANIEKYVFDLKKKASMEFNFARKMIDDEEKTYMDKITTFHEIAQRPCSYYQEYLEYMEKHISYSLELIQQSVSTLKEQNSPIKLALARNVSDNLSKKLIPDIPELFEKFPAAVPTFFFVPGVRMTENVANSSEKIKAMETFNQSIKEIKESLKLVNTKKSKEGIEYSTLRKQVLGLKNLMDTYKLTEEDKLDMGDLFKSLLQGIQDEYRIRNKQILEGTKTQIESVERNYQWEFAWEGPGHKIEMGHIQRKLGGDEMAIILVDIAHRMIQMTPKQNH